MVRPRLVMPRPLLLALAPLIVTGGLAVVVCAELVGAHPLTMGPPRSVSEAIALRDDAAAARLIEGGADLNGIGLIRPGILSDRPLLATPLETAVIVDQLSTLEFLISRGAVMPRDRLGCLARDRGARAVLSTLGQPSGCRPGAEWEAVSARPR